MRATVLGGGSWGTALADLLANNFEAVTVWTVEEDVAEQIGGKRRNEKYLAGHELSEKLEPSMDLSEALGGADLIVVAIPTHAVREVLSKALSDIPEHVPIVTASKGIENETLMTVSDILEDVLPADHHPYLSYLSGPSFAKEVVQHQPTAVTVAAYWPKAAEQVQSFFATPYFRVYTTTDVVGVCFGGALKNVVAIGAGIADGLGLGHNPRAALMTRGLAEITRVGVAKGANPQTFMGLSGMGDLILTCTGELSRNRTVGLALGKGRKLEEILEELGMVAEGVKTTKSAHDLGKRLGVDLPITDAVHAIIYEAKPAKVAVMELMTREAKPEVYR